MTFREVLQLDKTQASIKKIDLFVASQEKMSDEYIGALAYKALVLNAIGKANEAVKLLFPLVPSFKEMGTRGIIYTCDAIIDICIDLKRFDQVTKYIEIKKNYLPVSKGSLYVKDNIKYYLSAGLINEARDELKKYLKEDISKEEGIFAKEELAKIFYKTHQYDEYLEITSSLLDYYGTTLEHDKISTIALNKLKIFLERKNYLNVILEGSQYIKDTAYTNKDKLEAATLLLEAYLFTNDMKRAGTIEADYCDLISEEYVNESIAFCNKALELYTKTNTSISIREYQAKIDSLSQTKKDEIKKEKKKKSQTATEEVVIPVITKRQEEEIITKDTKPLFTLPEPEVPEVVQKVKHTVKEIKSVLVSENFEKLSKVFDIVNKTSSAVKFREIYRQACIEISKEFEIEEVYLLYYNKKYQGLHYKTERAYDKKLEFEDLDKTINFASMTFETEAFLDPDNPTYSKDIVKNKIYDTIPYAFAYPLHDDLSCIGSIAYFSNNSFVDNELTYEALKLISEMINNKLIDCLHQEDVELKNKKLFFVNNNMSSGVKEECDGFIHFSVVAANMLGVLENMQLSDFYSKIRTSDLIEYKRIHEELYTLISPDLEYEYDFKKGDSYIRIKERFYPMISDGVITIVSLLDDITEAKKKNEALLDLAYTDPISKMYTELKLMVDLAESFDQRKLALAIVDIQDYKLYRELYGYNFANQIVFAVGEKLKLAFETEFNVYLYHLNSDQYAVLFDTVNDKRAVENKLRSALNKVSNEMFKLNSRVKLKFNSGIYRLSTHSTINDVSEILTYAYNALDDAKDMTTPTDHICHYDPDAYKKRFNENQLVTHISESIDHGKIGVVYKQIVNLKEGKVLGYYSDVNLDNFEIESSQMKYVINRRGLTSQVEKYQISNVFKEEKMLYESVRGYVLAFIPVSRETILESFYSFVDTQRQFFKINPEYFSFVVDDASTPVMRKLRSEGFKITSTNIFDVINDCCDYLLLDYHQANLNKIKEIKNICSHHYVECIFNNIDTKEDLKNATDYEFDYIFGNYYKKITRMKSLIEKMS